MQKCPSASEGNCAGVVVFVVVFPLLLLHLLLFFPLLHLLLFSPVVFVGVFPPVVFVVVIITVIVLVAKATIEILPLQGILKHSSNTHTLVAL